MGRTSASCPLREIEPSRQTGAASISHESNRSMRSDRSGSWGGHRRGVLPPTRRVVTSPPHRQPCMILGTVVALKLESRSENQMGEGRGDDPYVRFNLPRFPAFRHLSTPVESAFADATGGLTLLPSASPAGDIRVDRQNPQRWDRSPVRLYWLSGSVVFSALLGFEGNFGGRVSRALKR